MAQSIALDGSKLKPVEDLPCPADFRIFRAIVLDSGKEVAVKEYQQSQLHMPGDIAVIMEEVQKLVDLPAAENFVAYLGAYVQTGVLYIVRDYVPGTTFTEVIPSNTYDAERIRDIGVQMCDSVSFLHQNDVYNYNIKPENVILKEDGSIALCDYAMLELRGSIQKKGPTSKRADPAICPPELHRGAEFAQEKTDVYSIGFILWMLCAKKIPRVRRPFDPKVIKDEKLKIALAAALKDSPEVRCTLEEFRAFLSP